MCTAMTPGAAPHHRQVLELARTFLARFFENESTAGRTDLRESFLWLLGFLAAPGVCFAVYQQFFWHFALSGPRASAQLQAIVLHDKTAYLTITMVVIGILTIATRNALVVDRRDAAVLGVLPIRPLTIVVAKLSALTAYVGLLSLGMHLGAAVLFGFFLGNLQADASTVRIASAHLVAATAAGTFVFLSIVALECVCLAAAGPRRFARAATVLQTLMLASIVAMLFGTPMLAREAATLVAGGHPPSWLMYVPPIWFLGLYETLSGPAPLMTDLARTAWGWLGLCTVLVGAFYPIASRRILRGVLSDGGTVSWRRRRATPNGIVGVLARSSDVRAALQFLTATTGRVGRFRLTMAAAVGAALAMVAPLILFWTATGLPTEPSVSLLAAPLLLSAPIVGGWRIVASMPSELNARWVFLAAPLHGLAGRAAVVRMAFATGVLLPLFAVLPVWIATWGVATSMPFVGTTLLAGGVLVGVHFWGFAGVPCTRPLAVSESNLQGRWPFYLFGLFVYVAVLPTLEVLAAGRALFWVLATGLLAAWLVVRTMANQAAHLNIVTNDHRGLILLDLGIVPQPRHTAHPVVAPPAPTITTETRHA